jgi:hypothetical protein
MALPPGFKLEEEVANLPPGFKLEKPVAPEPAFEREARDLIGTSGADVLSATPSARILTAAGRPLLVGAGKIASLFGGTKTLEAVKQLDEMQKRGARALESDKAAPGYPIAPTTAQDLAGGLIGPLGIGVASKVPLASSYLGKVAQGTAIGTVAGATSDPEQTVAPALTGAAIGAAIPGVVAPLAAVGKAAYHGLIEPWANSAAIKGRAFLEAAGDKADDIIAALRQNKQIVPGSAPTAGEAAAGTGRAEFANLQRQAQQINPSAYDARAGEQAAARLGQVRTVGQTPEALAAAEGARSAAADPLYKAARQGGAVVTDGPQVVQRINDLLAKNPGNRELVTELNNIKKGLLNESGSTRIDAQQVSSVVDGLKATLKDPKNAFIGGALEGFKNDLIKAIPGMERAQKVFADKSPPVNQMQVGQYLEGKLTNPLDETARQRAAGYAGALRDAPGTIKRSTGSPRFDELTQVLNPQQLQAVNSVRDDLARGARFEDLAGKGATAAPKIGGEIAARAPQMLSRAVMIYNAIITRLEGKVDKKLAAEIAVEMLNPPKVAATMAQAKIDAARNAVIVKALQQAQLPAASIAAGESTK